MRVNLVQPGSGELTYEIRNIVNVAEKLQKCGVTINWENIGDPIVKGEQIPAWMKEIVAAAVHDNDSWGYCHTRGVLKTREFICQTTNQRGGAQITPTTSSSSTVWAMPSPRFTAVCSRRRGC